MSCMSTSPNIVPTELDPDARCAAEKLGFTELRVYDRDGVGNPLIRARWRGAPVSISVRTDLAGGICVAFYRGEVPVQADDDGGDLPMDVWDEVADTRFADQEMGLVVAAALLEHYGAETAAAYRDTAQVHD